MQTKKKNLFQYMLVTAAMLAAGRLYGTENPTFEPRIFGPIIVLQNTNATKSIMLNCSSKNAALNCASKYLTDILGFGPAKLVSGSPTIVELADGGFCQIALKDRDVQINFAKKRNALHISGLDWQAVPANAYPRWFDRFDNDAVAVGVFGWGNIPKNVYGDLAWARQYFRRILQPLACEADYIAPGVYDFSFTDWWLRMGKKYDFSTDIYPSYQTPGRPTFPWNVVPLPHIGNRPFLPLHNKYRIGLLAYCQNTPIPSTDPYLFAGQQTFAEHVKNNPRYTTYFASAEVGGLSIPFLDAIADAPETRAAWGDYLKNYLVWSLAEVGKRHYGDANKFRSWKDVTVPRLCEFTGYDLKSSRDLLKGKWEALVTLGPKSKKMSTEEPKWFSANPGDPGFQAYHPQGDTIRFRTELEIGQNDLANMRYLHVQPIAWHICHFYVTRVILNGQEQKDLTNRSPVYGDLEECFQLDVRPGKNTLEIETAGQPLAGYAFLSPHGRWAWPTNNQYLNRRYFDAVEFAAKIRADHIANVMKNYREGDGNSGRPQLVMACGAILDTLLPSMVKHGGFPHDTGVTGVTYAPWTTTYGVLQNVPISVEPGMYPKSPESFQKQVTLYLALGVDSVNFLFAPAHYRDTANGENGRWLEQHAELVRCLGKLELPKSEVGVLRSIRNAARFRFSEPWTFDVSRGAIQSVGRHPQLVDLEDINSGRAQKFPVIFDAGSVLLTDADLAGIENYVRNGGIFIATHHTGRHSPETANAWPISKLTGLKVVRQGYINGKLQLTSDQDLWPELRDKVISGAGLALDYLGKNHIGESIGMEGGSENIKVIAYWKDVQAGKGRIAAAERKIGKGRLIVLGSPFYFNCRDNNGSWKADENTHRYLGHLLDNLGIHRVSSVIPGDKQIFAEKWRSKNGLYDLYMVARINSTKAVSEKFRVTFYDSAPDHLFEISAKGHPEVKFIQDGSQFFTISDVSLEPMQCRIFAAPVQDPVQSPKLWLESLSRRWGKLVPLEPCSTIIQKPSPWIMPLVDGWEAIQKPAAGSSATSKKKIVSIGSFDTMGLDPARTAIFRKTVTLPESWKNRRVELLFDSPARYFVGIFPRGSVRINGRNTGMKFTMEESDQAVPVAIPEDGILNIEVRVDGLPKWETESKRPVGISGMFYLLANPQPEEVLEIEKWKVVREMDNVEEGKPGESAKFRYLEYRFNIPENWPRENIFFEVDYSFGMIGWLELNGRVVSAPSGGEAPYRQLLIDGLLLPSGKENVLRWAPHTPGTSEFNLPKGRIAVWPDLPYASGK